MSDLCKRKGKYGTQYKFAIDYGDPPDRVGTWHTWAYDAEHAMDSFLEGSAEDGFRPMSEPRKTRCPPK